MLTLAQQEECIESYQGDLVTEIDAGGLLARNSIAHKWKVTNNILVLRELSSWRFCDLIKQSLHLQRSEYYIGSAILIRASIETLALLIFSSRKMMSVVKTGTGFHELTEKVVKLLLGSKGDQTIYNAVHINDFLNEFYKSYPEFQTAYNDLSELSHPNFDGLSLQYSAVSDRGMKTTFFKPKLGTQNKVQNIIITMLLTTFEIEYNDRWITAFDDFETWIVKNDSKLENSRN